MSFFKLLFKFEVIMNSLVIIFTSTANTFFYPTLEKHLEAINIVDVETIALQFFLGSSVYVISTLIIGRYLHKIRYQFGVELIGLCFTILSLLVIGPSEFLSFLKPGLLNTSMGMILIGLGCAFGLIPSFECYYRSSIKFGLKDSAQTYGYVAGLWSSMFSLG